MVLDEKWLFFHTFFRQNRPEKYLLPYSRTTKTPFYAIKTRSSKSPKIDIFSKEVNPCFWSKNGHFSNFFFRHYSAEKCLLRYSRTEKRLSRLEKQEVQKVENGHFSKGVNPWFWSKNGLISKGVNPWFWSKNGHICNFLFLGNIGQENVFYEILERKKLLSRL